MAEVALRLVNGVPRTVTIATTASEGIYDETIVADSLGYAVNDIITLPSSGSYESVDLKIFHDGSFWEPGVDYNYVGTGTRTQIELLRPVLEGEKLRFRVEGTAAANYDETIVAPVGGYAAASTITLPSTQTYLDSDLKVYLDGTFLQPLVDYNYVGSPGSLRTQIQLVLEIFEGERLRFRID
jgi:hypothetical protein